MKYFLLKKVCERFQDFDFINSIKRVDDTILKLEFNREHVYYIDLKRGTSTIFKKSDFISSKNYQAPFDLNLQKLFSKVKVESVAIKEGDRILSFKCTSSQKYKSTTSTLQLEFTGRNTNAIILNDEDIIVEALRHVDISNTFREIRPGKKLLDLPARELKEKEFEVEDIDIYLEEEFERSVKSDLENRKKQEIASLLKRQKSLLISLDTLADEKQLLEEAEKSKNEADLILANLHILNIYDKKAKVVGFDGVEVEVHFPQHARDLKEASRILYDRSKKAKQKAKNLYIEKENLEDKILYFNRLIAAIKSCESIDELNLYTQKKEKKRSKDEKKEDIPNFFIEGYKVSVGRNQRENNRLLQIAKADDIWMHLKDRASSHVIIHTGKQKIDEKLLYNAAKMCVNFSGCEKGKFSVDYTRRKFVKVQDGANVLYTHDRTIIVSKE